MSYWFHNAWFALWSFFSLLVSSTCCKDLMSVKLAVCHRRVIRGGEKSNFLIIRLNFNGEKKMKSWVKMQDILGKKTTVQKHFIINNNINRLFLERANLLKLCVAGGKGHCTARNPPEHLPVNGIFSSTNVNGMGWKCLSNSQRSFIQQEVSGCSMGANQNWELCTGSWGFDKQQLYL